VKQRQIWILLFIAVLVSCRREVGVCIPPPLGVCYCNGVEEDPEALNSCMNKVYEAETSGTCDFSDSEDLLQWFNERRVLHENMTLDDLKAGYYGERPYLDTLSIKPSRSLYWPQVAYHYELGTEEREAIDKDGFVITSRRQFNHPVDV